jgi:hypothetical protein
MQLRGERTNVHDFGCLPLTPEPRKKGTTNMSGPAFSTGDFIAAVTRLSSSKSLHQTLRSNPTWP